MRALSRGGQVRATLFLFLAGCSAASVVQTSPTVPTRGSPAAAQHATMARSAVLRIPRRATAPTCALVSPSPAISLPPTATKTSYPYSTETTPPAGLSPDHTVFVYYPGGSSPTLPTIMLIHGGGLNSRDDKLTKAAAPYLAQQLGVVVVYPEYTIFTGSSPTTPSEIVAASNDLGCAYKWIQTYVFPALGNTKAKKVLIAGYSAGGQLAAMLGTQSTYITQYGITASKVAGIAPMSGRYDWRMIPCCESNWSNKHGSDSVSPYVAAASATPYPYPWLVTYEQCDADTQFGTTARFLQALQSSGSDVTYYEGTPNAGQISQHGAGDQALGGSGPDYPAFLEEFESFENYTVNLGNPSPSPAPLEAIPFPAALPSGVKDIAAGGDGSLWVVGTGPNNQIVAKYGVGCFASGVSPNASGPPSLDVSRSASHAWFAVATPTPTFSPVPPEYAAHIAVDGNGDPWVKTYAGTIAYLPGGLEGESNAQATWAPVPAPTFAVAIGAGGPYPTSNVWMIGIDGRAYQHVGAGWMADTPSGITLGSTSRITVDAANRVWVVDSNTHNYYVRVGGVWSSAELGSLIQVGGDADVFGVGTDFSVNHISPGANPAPVAMPSGLAASSSALHWPAIAGFDHNVYLLHFYSPQGSSLKRHHRL